MIKDPNNTYIDDTVTLEDNVTIYPNVTIEGDSYIGENTVIYPGSYIKNARIGKLFTQKYTSEKNTILWRINWYME